MNENKPERSSASSEKRDPGFVKIRRGLLAHLRRMSSNATKLYLFLHLKAFWQGPKRGSVEANIDDLMFFLGWSRSMVKRTISELVQKGYILFDGAANQHELGTIGIAKFDVTESDSARLTSEPSTAALNSAGFTAGLSGGLTGEPSSEPSTPSKLQDHQGLQAPKNAVEVKKKENEKLDAVRRPVDAELRIANRNSFSPSEKRKKLEKRLEAKALKGGNRFEGDLDAEEIAAFGATQYRIRDRKCLTSGFVYVVWVVYDDWKDEGLPPGILCSKIIDCCKAEQEGCKKLGSDPSEYFWPPDFQDHRDRLRAEERRAEVKRGPTTERHLSAAERREAKNKEVLDRVFGNHQAESDEVARVAGPRGVDARWAHLMKDPLELEGATRLEEHVIDAEMAQQLISQFPEAWDTVAA